MKRLPITALVLVSIISFNVYATPIDTVTMTPAGYGAKDIMKIWGGGHSGLNVYAGVYMFEKIDGSGQGDLFADGIIGGFCMDLRQYVAEGTEVYDVIEPSGGPVPTDFLGGPIGGQKAAYLSELWGRHYDPAWSSGGSYTTEDKSRAEAFAAAVWEVIYEDLSPSAGWDVTSDDTYGAAGFRAENLDAALANSWLASLDGSGPMADLRSLSNAGVQDFLAEVPEPATVMIISAGLLFVVRTRKFS